MLSLYYTEIVLEINIFRLQKLERIITNTGAYNFRGGCLIISRVLRYYSGEFLRNFSIVKRHKYTE